jgi:hypothetical protein
MFHPSHSGSHAVPCSREWRWLSWGWRWFPSGTIATVCVVSFLVLLTPTTNGRQVSNTLRFLLGWQHIAQHQRQLPRVVDYVLQKSGLPTTVYELEGTVPQRRGREHWQRQKHMISVSSVLSLTTFETLFQATLPCPPFSVLARRVRRTPSHTAVELTQEIQQTGIAVVPVSRLVQ